MILLPHTPGPTSLPARPPTHPQILHGDSRGKAESEAQPPCPSHYTRLCPMRSSLSRFCQGSCAAHLLPTLTVSCVYVGVRETERHSHKSQAGTARPDHARSRNGRAPLLQTRHEKRRTITRPTRCGCQPSHSRLRNKSGQLNVIALAPFVHLFPPTHTIHTRALWNRSKWLLTCSSQIEPISAGASLIMRPLELRNSSDKRKALPRVHAQRTEKRPGLFFFLGGFFILFCSAQ